MKVVVVSLEVPDDVTPEQVFEKVCMTIHGTHAGAQTELKAMVTDIQLLDSHAAQCGVAPG